MIYAGSEVLSSAIVYVSAILQLAISGFGVLCCTYFCIILALSNTLDCYSVFHISYNLMNIQNHQNTAVSATKILCQQPADAWTWISQMKRLFLSFISFLSIIVCEIYTKCFIIFSEWPDFHPKASCLTTCWGSPPLASSFDILATPNPPHLPTCPYSHYFHCCSPTTITSHGF